MKNKALIPSLIMVAVGAFILYWASTHSPKAGIGKMVQNELSGSYTMSEPWFYASLVVGTVIAVVGLMRTFKALK